MIYLNAGNLWTDEYLDEVIRLNDLYKNVQVKSLFGSISGFTPTARSRDRLPEIKLSDALSYCIKAKKAGISIRYTLNQSCLGSMEQFYKVWKDSLEDNLIWLNKACGVHEWTVTSPLLVELLRSLFPADFIEVSTIAEVSTPTEALRWKNLGVDGVNVSTSINRDFDKIASMNNLLQVSLLANEACLYKCPWRRECYNLSSHDSSRSEELFSYYPFRRCNTLRMEEPVEWLKARMILPQWMREYQRLTGVSWFKIAYRTHPIEVALPILKAYMESRYDDNLLNLWPTIRHLAETEEPQSLTNIPCSRLGQFLNHWIPGDECVGLECDECGYCYNVYDRVAREQQ